MNTLKEYFNRVYIQGFSTNQYNIQKISFTAKHPVYLSWITVICCD